MIEIAALFVQPDGCYKGINNIDLWPEQRDARNYDGPYPVIAHPPCQLWGNLAAVNFARWGGEHNRPGNDKGCFHAALEAVNRWGGVLEHPANSKAFAEHGVTPPVSMGWQLALSGGWVCEVWQSAYGHKANKATWLYYRGASMPPDMDWRRVSGTHQIGGADRRGKHANRPTIRGDEASATPVAFRDALIHIALHA